ncbi:hypothetical protein BASA81_002543 [Batrachochytrium salamandrivorans]|nr:hypothetical protein BASA81_002543 [Batrachochytrium salamandrivorans]
MNVLCGESEHQETRGGKPATLLLKQELLEFHRVPSGAEMFCPRRATSTSSPTPCRQTGSRARCCGTRRAPEKKKRLARKRELLALPKDLKRVRPEPSAKRAELYVAPTGSSKRVVGVDPGKSDLISSGTGPGDWFRYTQKRDETGEKKHRRARTKMARTLVEGKTVVEWELSTFSRKALTVSAATAYFTKKNEVNARLFPHYEQEAYRVLKWRAFVNRRRSEDRMVNRFRDKFGDEVVLGWGRLEPRVPDEVPGTHQGRGHAEVVLESGLRGGAGGRVPHLVHLLRVRGGRVREVQERDEPAPLDAREETYGPAKRAAQLPKLQAAVEQGPQRVAQHHAVRPGGETGRPEAILHDQKLQ